jgi:hypothetical protein
MTLERFFDDFGGDLERAARTPARRRARRRTPLALAGATLLGAAAIALLPAPRGGDDVIAQAQTALSAPGEVVHMVVRTSVGADPRHPLPPVEQWYASDPVRWRAAQEFPPRRNSRGRPQRYEWGVLNGRYRFYDVARDRIQIQLGGTPMSSHGLGPSAAGGDPATELRELLAAGDVRDDGVVTVDGRQVRRLVAERPLPDVRNVRQEVTYHMDPQTFAPISGELRMIVRGRRTDPLDFTVERYERLPLNAETEKLLRFQTTPQTRTSWIRLRPFR